MRIILVDTIAGWGIPFDTMEEADLAAFHLVKEAIGPVAEGCETREQLINLSCDVADGSQFSYGGDYIQVTDSVVEGKQPLDIILQEEGDAGVAAAFSSSDRQSFTFPIPVGKDANTGSGDPWIILTQGVASGTKVQGYIAEVADYDRYLGGLGPKLWMVSRFWKVSEEATTEIRSVVEADDEAEAEKLAPAAIEKAVISLAGFLVGQAAGPVMVHGEM